MSQPQSNSAPVVVIDRPVLGHHDGHGLNESISIVSDQPNDSGAAHTYYFYIDGREVGHLQFQRGPRNVEGSTPGVTEAAVYAVLLDRLAGFQGGPYPSIEGLFQCSLMEEGLASSKRRADERAARGVLGRNEK